MMMRVSILRTLEPFNSYEKRMRCEDNNCDGEVDVYGNECCRKCGKSHDIEWGK